MYKKTLTKEQGLEKLKHFCAYQERSHHEVTEKLYALGVWKRDHDEIISSLIEQNFLNEERFAIAFAGGRFRMKQWGRVKIRYEMKLRKIGDYLIRKGLAQIPEDDYLVTLSKLAEKKWLSLKGEQPLMKRKKTMDYLLQKGFEANLAQDAVSEQMTADK